MLSLSYLRRALSYNPKTGVFTWRYMPEKNASWNKKYAGKIAGYFNHGYRMIGIDHKKYRAGRLAWFWMTGYWPVEIDHKDRNPANDQWSNLRSATRSQNNTNRTFSPRRNALGVPGVHLTKEGKYRAQIRRGGKKRSLGTFPTLEEAAEAYRAAADPSL